MNLSEIALAGMETARILQQEQQGEKLQLPS